MWIISMLATFIVSWFVNSLIPPSAEYNYMRVIPILVAIAIMGGFIVYQLKSINDSIKDRKNE